MDERARGSFRVGFWGRYNSPMTSHAMEAVFQNGVFLPTGQVPRLEEGQHVRLMVEVDESPDVLELAGRVYDGLSEEERDAVEAIALERRDFFGEAK